MPQMSPMKWSIISYIFPLMVMSYLALFSLSANMLSRSEVLKVLMNKWMW